MKAASNNSDRSNHVFEGTLKVNYSSVGRLLEGTAMKQLLAWNQTLEYMSFLRQCAGHKRLEVGGAIY